MSEQQNVGACPDVEVLEAYFEGHGDGQLDQHIATCSSCLDRLEKLHEDQLHNAATPIHDVKKYLNEPEFPQFQQKIHDLVSTVPHAEPPLLPDRINRFEVCRWLGRGTFGDVYAAFDPLLKIDVAIKVSRSGLFSSTSSQADFLREAQHVARLNHPGLVHIRDVIIDDDRTAIVMNLVDGGTLKDRLKTTETAPLALADAVGMMIQIARAAHFAHEAGLIHRDLKPANILLEADGHPVIADFGLAFDHREQSSDSLHRAGTLSYMSPEQYGPPSSIGRRCDLWAMGVILAEMIHGERPFPQRTRAELERAIRDEPPQLPDNPTKRHLNMIIKKCLAKPPEDRYATADEFSHDLEQWHKEYTATGISRWKYGWRRHVALAASALLILGIIFLAQRQSREIRLSQTAANLEAATTSQIPRLVNELTMMRASPDFLKGQSVSSDDDGRFRLNLARGACGDNDPQLCTDIVNYLRTAKLEEFKAALTPGVCDSIRDGLLTSTRRCLDGRLSSREFLRLTAIVAHFGNDDTVWSSLGVRVAEELCSVPDHELADWQEIFHPIGARFLGERLKTLMTSAEVSETIQHRSSTLLCSFFRGDIDQLTELIRLADGKKMIPLIDVFNQQPKSFCDQARDRLFESFLRLTREPRNPSPDDDEPPTEQDLQSARVAIALWKLGDAEAACRALRDDPNPTLQRLVIFGLKEQSISLIKKIDELRQNASPESNGIVFGLLQTLWLSDKQDVGSKICHQWLNKIYVDKDSGIHSMGALLARRFGVSLEPLTEGIHGEWCVDRFDDITMEFRVIETKSEFFAGRPNLHRKNFALDSWRRHKRIIDHRFAIGLHEVTWEQIRKTRESAGSRKGVVAGDAAATHLGDAEIQDVYHFCNWCSEIDGLDPCYEPDPLRAEGRHLVPRNDYLLRSGYRLPTDGEWECACRAGTESSCFFGQLPTKVELAKTLINQYAWMFFTPDRLEIPIAQGQILSQPVGHKLPNRWGLFDTYGNVMELCVRSSSPEDGAHEIKTIDSVVRSDEYENTFVTCIRGAGLNHDQIAYVRSHARTERIRYSPMSGIRIAKTLVGH